MPTENSEFHHSLHLAREQILQNAQKAFQEKAIEGHVFGSMGRRDPDPYSDLDLWFTFEDEGIEDVLAKRFDYYAQIGEVVHIQEAHQNAPINGKYAFILYKTFSGLLQMDISLCPRSTSFEVKGSRKLFGKIELPEGVFGYNPKKVIVDEAYRIDGVTCFVFMGIKKIARGHGLDDLFREYDYLSERYGITTDPLPDREHNFETLLQVITNLKKVSNDRQENAFIEIENFATRIKSSLDSET